VSSEGKIIGKTPISEAPPDCPEEVAGSDQSRFSAMFASPCRAAAGC
jgi:hypothetical protein